MGKLQGVADTLYIPLTARIQVSSGLVSFGGDEKTLRLIEDMLKSLNSQSVSGGSL